MTTEAQRVAIAEACGFINVRMWNESCIASMGINAKGEYWGSLGVSDYLNDLNAIHEAERTIGLHGEDFRGRKLRRTWATYTALCDPRFLTAAQRAQALLMTINKWTNDN
jgi:hypothetical protein